MTPLATNATSPGASPAKPSGPQEQLVSTLEALIYNDEVDLNLFHPEVLWPQARNITQQPHTPFRTPSPEERTYLQPQYGHTTAVDYNMGDAAEYSQTYSDTFQFFHTHPDGCADKAISWRSHIPELSYESSVATVPSYVPPPPPATPPPAHRHGHLNSSDGLTTSQYGQSDTNEHDGFLHYGFSESLNTLPARSASEAAYSSITKSPNLPLFDFMSWDMFMDYGNGPPPGANDINNNESANSADDFYEDRKGSLSPRAKQIVQHVQPPAEATSQIPKRVRRQNQRQSSKCATPSPPPCSWSNQGTDKGGQPRAHRAHSVIEKRYRAGINEKFEALRTCVERRKRPKQESLGQVLQPENKEGETGGDNTTGLDRKKSAGGNGDTTGKMNKAEVLSEAAEYIQQLEDENGLMLDQLKVLVQRLRATRMALSL